MSKTAGVVHKQSKRRQQGHSARQTKTQAGGALTLCGEGRLHNAFNTFLGEMTVVADTLDVQQTSIDFSTDLLQEGQQVEFTVEQGPKGLQASNVVVIG
jgi:hypothetical protein